MSKDDPPKNAPTNDIADQGSSRSAETLEDPEDEMDQQQPSAAGAELKSFAITDLDELDESFDAVVVDSAKEAAESEQGEGHHVTEAQSEADSFATAAEFASEETSPPTAVAKADTGLPNDPALAPSVPNPNTQAVSAGQTASKPAASAPSTTNKAASAAEKDTKGSSSSENLQPLQQPSNSSQHVAADHAASSASTAVHEQGEVPPGAVSATQPAPQPSHAAIEGQGSTSEAPASGQADMQSRSQHRCDDAAQASHRMNPSSPFLDHSVALQGLRMLQNRSAVVATADEDIAGGGPSGQGVLLAIAAIDPLPWFMLAAAGVVAFALWVRRRPKTEDEHEKS